MNERGNRFIKRGMNIIEKEGIDEWEGESSEFVEI